MAEESAVRTLLTDELNCNDSFVVGDVVYVSASDTVDKASAASGTTDNVLGVIFKRHATGKCIVQIEGECTVFTGLTPGSVYYLSDTAGDIQTTPGTNTVKVGLAIDTDTLLLVPGGAGLGSSGPTSPFIAGAGSGSALLSGAFNAAGGDHAVAEGSHCTASGAQSHVGGSFSQATAAQAFAHGAGCLASKPQSMATGLNSQADKFGQFARTSGSLSTGALLQYSDLLLIAETTGATPVEMFLDSPTNTERINIGVAKVWSFMIRFVATGDTESAQFIRTGMIRRTNTGGGTVSLVGSVQTIGTDIGSNGGAPPAGWAVTITADDTNKALAVTVTGEAGVDVWWAAKVELVETTHANVT